MVSADRNKGPPLPALRGFSQETNATQPSAAKPEVGIGEGDSRTALEEGDGGGRTGGRGQGVVQDLWSHPPDRFVGTTAGRGASVREERLR